MGKYNITASVFDKRGRLLAKERNSYERTHVEMLRLSRAADFNFNRVFLHAEVAALIKAGKRGRPYSIVIERYHADGSPALSKPCPACELAIKLAGIRKISYTIG